MSSASDAQETSQAIMSFAELLVILVYPVMIAASILSQVYIYVNIFNHNLERLRVQRAGFESKLKVMPFFWITLSNVFAIVFTLGLLAPWAAIRKARYMAESVSISNPEEGLGDFAQETADENSAIGDAAAEAFDFDFGW